MDREGQIKSSQAYQVIGTLTTYRPHDDELERALNYFADVEAFDEEFLPWPR